VICKRLVIYQVSLLNGFVSRSFLSKHVARKTNERKKRRISSAIRSIHGQCLRWETDKKKDLSIQVSISEIEITRLIVVLISRVTFVLWWLKGRSILRVKENLEKYLSPRPSETTPKRLFNSPTGDYRKTKLRFQDFFHEMFECPVY